MSSGFVATEFSVVWQDGVLITILGAPSTEEDDFYLVLQHKEEHNEQDVRFGLNLPYIEYCGQGWSWYGHILDFTLHRDRVNVQMDAEAADRMQNDGHLHVQFSLSDSEFQELRSALQKTFAGHAYFHDLA